MDDTKKLLSVSKPLEKLIDQSVRTIFSLYRDRLVSEKVDYIIPAVWGSVKTGSLDSVQSGIFKIANHLVEESSQLFGCKGLEPAQKFAFRYLINRSLIYSISFMVENCQHKLSKDRIDSENLLINLPPSGNA